MASETPDSTAHPSHVLDESEYGQSILAKLNEFRQDALFTDAVLCVDEEEFPCHKNVLAVSSPYFQAMFTSDLRESRENRICFNEVSPLTLKRVIDYAYSGKVEINTSNAQEMLAAACLFQYPAIVTACEEFLEKQLHASNCLCIEMFAQLHSCTKLQDSAHKFALDNFSSVIENDEFLELSLERLQEYISSDLIDVRTEATVYNAVLRWVKFELDQRKCFLPNLLSNVRLAVLDLSSLRIIENEPLVNASDKCLELLQEAEQLKQSFHQTEGGKRRRSMQDSLIQPRPSTVAKEMIVILGGLTNQMPCSRSVDMYDPYKDKWVSLQDFPQSSLWSSVTVLNNCIYVAGGIVDGHIIDKVWKFDSVQRKWVSVSSMLKPRARHAAAVLEEKMYVFGGVRYERKLLRVETIECYNPVTNTWTAAGRTMFPRQESCVVPFNNSIVEVGGLQGEEAVVKTMDSYHIIGDTIKPSGEQIVLPEPIQYAKIVVISNVFYILWEDSGKLIALNAKKRTFQDLPCMKYPRKWCGTSVLNGKVYVAGGLIGGEPSCIVESFDPATNKWSEEKPLEEGKAYPGCVTVKMC